MRHEGRREVMHAFLAGKDGRKSLIGRPKRICEDNIKIDLKGKYNCKITNITVK